MSVEILGHSVHRDTGWWTPAVHDLLQFLREHQFPYAPRVIGSDHQGREVLRYIPGESGEKAWHKVVNEAGLAAFARLLRSYHDAVANYEPPSGTRWAYGEFDWQPGQVICHGDFGPWNVVWQGLEPVGLLDWDFAYLGPALDDVAYALEFTAPFRDDETCLQWLGYDDVPVRPRRIALFASAYGLASTDGLVDAVIRRQQLTIEHVRSLSNQGLPTRPDWPEISERERRVT